MKEEIKAILKKEGIKEIGFTNIKYYKELESYYNIQEEKGYKTSFQTGLIDDKTFKYNKLYNTAVVVLLPYQKPNISLLKNEVTVSSSAWGKDYHIVLKEKLLSTHNYLINKGFKAEICVDNNNLDERYLAYKAGLGFYGLNHLLINDRHGSYFFIGVILTDAIIEEDKPLNKTCMKCYKCINACPTKALGDKVLNANKCLSYITQKKELTKEEEKLINNTIYGCDKCSLVCPHNNNIEETNNFLIDDNIIINIDEYNKLSNKEFKEKYGSYAFAWRGKKVFERNIELYKENIENSTKM